MADQERAAARERAGAGPGDTLFLFVGRLEPEKGVDVLLDAWRTSGLEGARLAFAGDGPLAAKTASQGPTVRSLGYVAPPSFLLSMPLPTSLWCHQWQPQLSRSHGGWS